MGISAQPSTSTCKAPCARARFLLEGRQLIFWSFLLFRILLWIIQVSQGQQLLVLLSSSELCWDVVGVVGREEAAACAQFGKQSGFLSLKTIIKHKFRNLSLVPPFGQGQLLLVHLSLHYPIIPGFALELPISPCTSGEALLDHPVSPGWGVWFHSMGFLLRGLDPCWPQKGLTCWRWSLPALNTQDRGTAP